MASPGIIIWENPGVKDTLIRLWEFDEDRFRNEQEALALVERGREFPGLSIYRETHNEVCNEGMQSVAALVAQSLATAQDGLIYAQALGSKSLTVSKTDAYMGQEFYRKQVSSRGSTGRILKVSTVFNSSDFPSMGYTEVASNILNTTSRVYVDSLAGSYKFYVGDMIRVYMLGGYEYVKITALGGGGTPYFDVTPALSDIPVAGSAIDELINECGMFGDKAAGYTTGTASVAAFGTTVTGVGTAWLSNVAAGDRIREVLSNGGTWSGEWSTIASVDSDTQLTLATFRNVGIVPGSGDKYVFEGTMFNHVSDLKYARVTGKGFIIENQWTWGG